MRAPDVTERYDAMAMVEMPVTTDELLPFLSGQWSPTGNW